MMTARIKPEVMDVVHVSRLLLFYPQIWRRHFLGEENACSVTAGSCFRNVFKKVFNFLEYAATFILKNIENTKSRGEPVVLFKLFVDYLNKLTKIQYIRV